MKVVLASSSRWRAGLLSDAGLACEACAPQVNEALIVGNGPTETARLRAQAKAEAVANSYPDDLVIGADQVLLHGPPIFGEEPGAEKVGHVDERVSQGNALPIDDGNRTSGVNQ